ncbi:MAG: class B sortase [Solobacterium sp.]|nr:class B sortase [Solobacterium sp.]
MKRNLKYAIVLCMLAVLDAVLLFLLLKPAEKPAEPLPEVTAEPSPTPTAEPLEVYEYDSASLQKLRAELQEDQGINPDVRALLCFQSGLIHAPVLQSTDVNEYLYKDWKTGEYLSYGSITLEPENDLMRDDQNTIIYGHYIYEFRNPDRTLAFTPLAELMDQKNWEPNRYLSLVTEQDIRYCEVVSVFECPLETVDGYQYTMEGFEYNLMSYTKEYMAQYKANIKAHEYYDTGVDFDETDHFITLQTCIEGNNDSRQIILCREVERIVFDEEE